MSNFLKWHLGLGDAIICAPLAVEIHKNVGPLMVPCYSQNEASVSSFFVEYPKITVAPFASEYHIHQYLKAHEGMKPIPIGFYKETPQLPGETFDRWLYRTAGVDFDLRWSPILHRAALLMEGKQYVGDGAVFLHEDVERGFIITKERTEKRKIFPRWESGVSILAYAKMLRNASEIHCIDSAFLHLVESLPMACKPGPDSHLYFHRYARPGKRMEDLAELRKPWKVIE
jgi:hypothetical protein